MSFPELRVRKSLSSNEELAYFLINKENIVKCARLCALFPFLLVAKKLRANALALHWELPVAYIPEVVVSS